MKTLAHTAETDAAMELLREVRLVEIKSRRLTDETMAGEYHSAFKGHGMSFAEVREYHPGDDVRAIDWNVTARTGRPHVKLYEEERELTVMLLVDLSRSLSFGTRAKTQRRLVSEMAATLAFSALKNGDKVGAIFFTDRVEKFIPPAKSRRHVLRIVSDLLSFRPEGHRTALAPALEYLVRALRKRCIAFVISDFMDQADYSLPLSVAARKHDVVAMHVYDPFQQELPDVGLLRVRDAETGRDILVDTSSPRQRSRHIAWWTEHRRRITDGMKRAGIDMASFPTHQDYAAPLRRLLQRLALFLGLLFAPAFMAQAQTIVEAKLDTAAILIGQQVQLQLSVKTDRGSHVEFPEYPPQGEMMPGVEVISATPVDTQLHNDGARLELLRRYTVTSFDSALYALRPAVVVGSDTLLPRTAVGLKVSTVPVDTLHPEVFRDPYGPVDAEFEFNRTLALLLLFGALAAASAVLLYLRMRRVKPRRTEHVEPLPPSPREAALALLNPLHQCNALITQEDYKAYYVNLTTALRRYLAARFDIDAMNMTTSQIAEALERLPETRQGALPQLLSTADLVKFARQQATPDEAQRNLQSALQFVDTYSPADKEGPRQRVRVVVETDVQVAARKRRLLVATVMAAAVSAVLFVAAAWEIYQLLS